MITIAEFEKVQAYINPGYTTRPKDKDYPLYLGVCLFVAIVDLL